MANSYATLEEFKAHYFPAGVTDAVDDMVIETILESTSRWIDLECNRRFYTTSADEARYYTAKSSGKLIPPEDILSVTTILTDEDGDGVYETTWLATDFRLCPVNAALDGKPYTWIETTNGGTKTFPTHDYAVKLICKVGYCTLLNAPEMIKQACLKEAEYQYKLKDAPFGVSGPTEFGSQGLVPMYPGAKQLLRQYRKMPYRSY